MFAYHASNAVAWCVQIECQLTAWQRQYNPNTTRQTEEEEQPKLIAWQGQQVWYELTRRQRQDEQFPVGRRRACCQQAILARWQRGPWQ